jgi:hypothetical protein
MFKAIKEDTDFLKCSCGWEGFRKVIKPKKPFGRYRGLTTWNCPKCEKEIDCYDSTD